MSIMAGQQYEVAESKVSKKARYIWRGCIYILRPVLKSNLRPQAYHCSTQFQPSTEQESLSTLISKQGKLISQSIHITHTPNPLSSDVSPFLFSLSFPFPLSPFYLSSRSSFFYLIFTSQTSPPHYSALHNAHQTKSGKQLREQTVLGGDVLVVRRLMSLACLFFF